MEAAPISTMLEAEARLKLFPIPDTEQRIIPAGVSEADFNAALLELENVVGVNEVSRDDQSGLERYRDPWHLTNGNDHLPGAAVRPNSVEQVQNILSVANKYSLPLWTTSRGKNFGYGGAAPVVRGSVVLDLGRMNKIIEVNEEYCYAIVEPGVTFFDLYNHIHTHKLKLWMSTPALGWGSVIGNTLDKGFGYTATGEHTQMQCGMEVILPNGQLMRTGMGALEDQRTWPLYKSGYGPIVDGLFYQSNMGVVTKMGLWLQPQPQVYMSCSISVEKEQQLVELTGIITDMQRKNIIQNSPSISNLFRQSITQIMKPEVFQLLAPHLGTKGCISGEVLEDIRQQMGWGFWIAEFALYGPEPIVEASWEHIQASFKGVTGVKFKGQLFSGKNGEDVDSKDLPHFDIPQSGTPHVTNMQLMDYRGPGSGHACFSPVIPPSGRELYDWYLEAKQRTIDAGFDFFADFHLWPRYVIAIELVVFSPEEAKRMDDLYRVLAEDAVKQGYSEYRTHLAYMDLIADHFTHNDSALRTFVTGLKDSLDPKGILSPGKQGIWGSSLVAKSARKK